MTTPRPASRRDYRHFPEAYTSLLLAFDRAGSASLGPMSHADAKAGARDLYRFKMFLSQGCDDDPDDAHCRSLLRIFNKLILRVELLDDAAPNYVEFQHTHLITLSTNPIVAAVAAMEARQ